ncbi:MAG: ACP S-malonyltransferase [Candidatus Omnitrophica bacterium]|nr:ACP S-malonyltransferase [Candidatus Omnitrophota bacterium]
MGNSKKTAYIFPGQGAQYVGMGKDLYDNFPQAKAVFEQANQVLGFDLARICFEGPINDLTKSAVCQPAILTHSIAVYQILKTVCAGKSIALDACAGLSLGEYSALVACGSLKFSDAVSLVHKRGQFMDQASLENPGTLACILGIDLEQAKKICEQANVEIANLNCPGQIVISGSFSAMKQAEELAKAAGAKRVIALGVSGPFHSSLMQSAADKLKIELKNVLISKPNVLFIPNVTAAYENDPEQIGQLLTKQVSSTTFWEKSIEVLQKDGINNFIEIGPGKVLRGLLQRINKELNVLNLDKSSDFDVIAGACGCK